MKREGKKFSFFLLLVTVIGMIGLVLVKEKSWIELIKPYGMTVALLLVIGSILETDQFQVILNKKQRIVGVLSYLFSVLLISLLPEAHTFNWWIVGPVIAALYVHLYFGIAMQAVLTFLLCGLYEYSIELLVFYGLIGGILCILTRYMTSRRSFRYVLMTALSSNLTLLFVVNNFVWKRAISKNTLYSLISTGIVVAIAYVLSRMIKVETPLSEDEKLEGIEVEPEDEKIEKAEVEETELVESEPAEIIETEEVEVETKEAELIQLELEEVEKEIEAAEQLAKAKEEQLLEILSEGFSLRQRLSEYSKDLYTHSLHISSIAQEAAICIGCNDKIVQAGGLYHEVGRIVGRDYIEEGVKLGAEYNLPKEVIDIIRQHNSKYEKPKSVEAAVVMLTDSIVSTIEYMEKEQKMKNVQISADKMVEQIFDIRLAKGTLDESAMNICDYKKLKEFFKNEYNKGENR